MRRLLFAPLLLVAGCPAPPTGVARAQDAAQEMNLNARFGRMELASEKVSARGRSAFVEHRSTWGNNVRIMDSELNGVRLVGDEDAVVTVRVSWQRVNEGDLRTTRLQQKWHDTKGEWQFVSEDRLDGDLGLIGEHVVLPPDHGQRKNAQFPTIRLGE